MKGKVAEAAGHATAGKAADSRGKAVEAAMQKATEDAIAEGIVDPAEILKRKYAARDAVRAEVTTSTNAEGVEHKA
jgi:hypothetical protein